MTNRYFATEHRHQWWRWYRRAPVRAARLIDAPDEDFELRGEIGIAVHLNDDFILKRRIGSRPDEGVKWSGEVCYAAREAG